MMKLYQKHHKPLGFTLIEVVMALAILSISLVALIKIGVQASDNNAYMRDKTIAHWVAMNKITELQVLRQWPEIDVTRGTSDMANQEWFWLQTTSSTADPDLRRVEVVVKRKKQEKSSLSRLVGFIERPPQQRAIQ